MVEGAYIQAADLDKQMLAEMEDCAVQNELASELDEQYTVDELEDESIGVRMKTDVRHKAHDVALTVMGKGMHGGKH